MIKKIHLSEVPVGETFEVWDRKFTVLKKEESKIFVLAAKFATMMPFRDENTEYVVAPNDFRDSSVKAYLNGEYIDELFKAGADRSEDILPLEIDLKCTLGQHEYGTDTVKAGLLTLEQYGEYYDIIPLIDSPWWLATPWKTPSRSPNTYSTNLVWGVHTGGNYYDNYCNRIYGVRPALNLNPLILVSYDDTNIDSNGLSHFTTDELLNEIKNRVKE